MVGSPVGGFFPIPLAMMIPFMATQSLIMGDAFGRSFQYGKRKISAMNNEEFNALTTEKIAETIYAEYKNIIPSLNQSLIDSQDLQQKVIDELLALPSNFLANIFDRIANPDKISNDFIPNSNNPADSRTWAPGWSPPPSQDFNPPTGAPQPSPTPIPPAPTGTSPGDTSPHIPQPEPVPVEKTYTIGVRAWEANNNTINTTQVLQLWLDFLKISRQRILTTSGSAQRLILSNITIVSTALHNFTGKWY